MEFSNEEIPIPKAIVISAWPITTPKRCGMVARSPKFTPDVISIKLLGPGVIELTKANINKPGSRLVSISF